MHSGAHGLTRQDVAEILAYQSPNPFRLLSGRIFGLIWLLGTGFWKPYFPLLRNIYIYSSAQHRRRLWVWQAFDRQNTHQKDQIEILNQTLNPKLPNSDKVRSSDQVIAELDHQLLYYVCQDFRHSPNLGCFRVEGLEFRIQGLTFTVWSRHMLLAGVGHTQAARIGA